VCEIDISAEPCDMVQSDSDGSVRTSTSCSKYRYCSSSSLLYRPFMRSSSVLLVPCLGVTVVDRRCFCALPDHVAHMFMQQLLHVKYVLHERTLSNGTVVTIVSSPPWVS
jgi:hypothetical protein